MMNANYMGIAKPSVTDAGCYVVVRRYTGSLYPQGTNCGCKPRPGKLTCRHHERYEREAQQLSKDRPCAAMTYAKRVVEEAAKVAETRPTVWVGAEIAGAIRAMPLPEPTESEREGLGKVIRKSWDDADGIYDMDWVERIQVDAVLAWLRGKTA